MLFISADCAISAQVTSLHSRLFVYCLPLVFKDLPSSSAPILSVFLHVIIVQGWRLSCRQLAHVTHRRHRCPLLVRIHPKVRLFTVRLMAGTQARQCLQQVGFSNFRTETVTAVG